MTTNSAQTLFKLIDKELDYYAKAITNKVFSESRALPWAAEQRNALRPAVRKELESVIQGVLGLFDNVGSTLPEGVSGWRIRDAEDGADIRASNFDYASMWVEYLLGKDDGGTS